MLRVKIPAVEFYDEQKEEFVNVHAAVELNLEHSLLSLSKWEQKWKIPFLTDDEKTDEQSADYVQCMTLNENVDPSVYKHLPFNVIDQISSYINDPMTATTISQTKKSGGRRIITSEVIYGWMVALNIPFECERWHLNRLLMLIQVCNEQNTPAKKMSKKEIADQNRALNASRKAKLNSKG